MTAPMPTAVTVAPTCALTVSTDARRGAGLLLRVLLMV